MQGALIKTQIDQYLLRLGKGEVTLPPHLVDECLLALKERMLYKRDETKGFRLMMSNLGKPLCQLQMEKQGAHKEPWGEVNMATKFITGDFSEAWIVMIMKAAGVDIREQDIRVELEIYGQKIGGLADIDIGGYIYDIKSASARQFMKYTDSGGFASILEDDPFGYVEQGFLYAEGLGRPFGGWIVLNKNSGEVAVCDVPQHSEEFRQRALERATERVKAIVDDAPFQRQFTDKEELFRKNPTGNKVLETSCAFCSYRTTCWPTLQYRPSVVSSAKNPPWVYYTEINYEKAEE